MNTNFTKQYINPITVITDGLTHKQKQSASLKPNTTQGLIGNAKLIGYRNGYAGYHDKYWRYDTNQETQYLHGVHAAINNGESIEHFIECESTRMMG
jgi:hypothetical protein